MSDDQLTPYRELAAVIDSLPLLLREARRARGLSMRAVAREVGISFSTVCRVEAGEGLHSGNLTAIMRWLDLTPTPDPHAAATGGGA